MKALSNTIMHKNNTANNSNNNNKKRQEWRLEYTKSVNSFNIYILKKRLLIQKEINWK